MSKLKKNVIWNMIGASTNAFTSLIFAIIVTRINGLEEAGIFTYAFATSCLFFVIAIYAGRAFQVTDVSDKYSDTDYIYHRILTCMVMILAIITFNIIKGYNIFKSSVMLLLCLYKVTEAFSEVWYAIIQKKEQLYKVGISMTIKAIVSMIVLFIIDYFTKNLILSCISIIVVNLLCIIFYDLKNIMQVGITKTKFNIEKIKSIFVTGFFTFILTFLGSYLINAPRYAIDDILTSDLQTIFGIIIMPATFMGLLGQYIIQPALTKIAKAIKEKDYKNLKKITTFVIVTILLIGILVLFVAYFLESPVLGIIYGVDLTPYILSMMIIIAGSIMYSLGIIISYILIAFRKTFIQAIIYTAVSIIATILSYTLVNKIQILGASITYAITMTIIALSFLIYLIYHIKKCVKSVSKGTPLFDTKYIYRK